MYTVVEHTVPNLTTKTKIEPRHIALKICDADNGLRCLVDAEHRVAANQATEADRSGNAKTLEDAVTYITASQRAVDAHSHVDAYLTDDEKRKFEEVHCKADAYFSDDVHQPTSRLHCTKAEQKVCHRHET